MGKLILIDKWFKRIIFFVVGIILGYILALILSQASNYVQLIGIVFSVLIGLGIPIWREYFVTQSKLSIEISSISRKITDAAYISLEEYPELSSIAPKNRRDQAIVESFTLALLRSESNRSNSKKGGVTIEQLDGLIENVAL